MVTVLINAHFKKLVDYCKVAIIINIKITIILSLGFKLFFLLLTFRLYSTKSNASKFVHFIFMYYGFLLQIFPTICKKLFRGKDCLWWWLVGGLKESYFCSNAMSHFQAKNEFQRTCNHSNFFHSQSKIPLPQKSKFYEEISF